ncbi:MAG: ABC transporter permease [Tistrella sp.]|uniref:ABC transporter permease n=1 Tax=Tistrella sp. TaxID=2024861 RepID=UPI000C667860|nr:ABC transporter permease [Tistrella sp.]MAD36766.1 ABC transporter permease [Tistrella sp.]MBA75874.1 ABC transporter permease [Tistrella sp.]
MSTLDGLDAVDDEAAPAGRPSPRGNRLLAVLVMAMAAATAFAGFVTIAPNRILSGRAVAAVDALPGAEFAILVLILAGLGATALIRPGRGADLIAAALAGLLFFGLLFAAGDIATGVLAERGTAARTSFGAGFWILAAAALLVLIDAVARLRPGPVLGPLGVVVLLGLIWAVVASGRLDDLSLMREYMARRDRFGVEILRHLQLVALALAIALPSGAALGLWARARRGTAPLIFGVLNLLQTVPSIALFALLIGPLTSLATAVPALKAAGVSGIGVAPAVIALALYALLPTARGVVAGFASVPEAAIEAARGMGLSDRQILVQVSLPLALPVLLAGLRIVLVQTIGLAVVAALIGAGGLGAFVFQGLGQTATDLVLLGALTAIALALAADVVLRAASAWLATRLTGARTS